MKKLILSIIVLCISLQSLYSISLEESKLARLTEGLYNANPSSVQTITSELIPLIEVSDCYFQPTIIKEKVINVFNIKNVGTANLEIYGFNGPAKDRFGKPPIFESADLTNLQLSQNNKLIIQPGKYFTLSVSFLPKDTIIYKDKIIFYSNTHQVNEFGDSVDALCNLFGKGILPLSLEDSQYKLFRFYPNPVSDYIIIEIPNNERNTIQMFDSFGNSIDLKEFQNFDNYVKISTQNLSQGIYFLVICINNQIINNKIVVIH